MNKKIILTKQSGGVLAAVDGNPKLWGWGKTTDEAVGSLMRTHRNFFETDLCWDMDDPYTKMFIQSPHDVCFVS